MDAKKLQQLQQSQNVQKKIPLAYQTNIADYRTATHSPVFQQQHQHQQQQHGNYHMTSHMNSGVGGHYQQSPTTTSSSGGGPLSPIDIQPQASKLLLKHQLQNSGSGGSSIQSSPYHQASISSGYPTSSGGGTDQLYQSPPERTYLQAAGRLGSSNSSALALQQQYQQIQQAKLQAQIASQNEAIQQQQQRNFAMRQAMNAAAPQGHYHMSQQQQQGQGPPQQHQQRAPPSSLNLTNQFQPASGPLKVNQQNSQKASQQHYHQQQQQEQIYGHHQQQQQQQQHQQQMQHLQMQQQQQQHHAHALQHRSKSDLQQTPVSNDQSPIYIQQNHPGHVVNQAVQTQISTVAKATTITKTPSSEDSSSASAKSPTHAPLDRKKSAGSSNSNAQALKSPITKRPPNSPVTISGWLYKQGSDGLKVWRKRWFVLAEYCLYYYKSPDEEKVLGSILLPSYKVSACLPEDKIYRKFAFKCEHQNMRTYWLAAENAESMVQWVRALSAATLMQATHGSAGDSSEHPSGSSSVNHSGENSDSGINTLQSKMSGQGQVTPASDNGGGVTASSSNSGGGAQPLYANAPPKPRRITDGGYSSPSPEHSVDNERTRSSQQQTSRRSGIMSPSLQQMQQQQYQQQQQQQRSQHHAIYDTRTGNVSSAIRVPQQQSNYNLDNLESQYQQQLTLSPEEYPSSPLGSPSQYMDAQMEQQIMQLQQQRMAVDDIYGERELYMQRLIQQRYPPNMAAYGAAAERRTPDAYGRSKNRLFSDYEDIYNLTAAETAAQAVLLQEAAAYRRPLSPPSYEDNKYMPTVPSRYTPNHLELTAAGSNLNLRTRPAAASMIRPHSADFLEYEARAEAASDAAAVAAATAMIKPDPVRAPRPKSSLDINRTPDSFYYSEENYAEKMRKSALYLQNPQAQPQAAAGSYRMATGSSDFLSPVASGMNTIAYENPYERIYKRNELLQDALGNQAGHTSIPRMSRSQTMGGGAQIRSSSTHPHHPLSPTMGTYQPPQQPAPPLHTPLLSSGLTTQEIIQQNEQFLRSASARLPKRSSTFDDEPLSANTTNTTPTSPPPPTGTTTGSSASGAGTTSGSTANSSSAATTAHLEGERKREESMKRLLEWKQRMLQSPLTRKSAQHVSNSASAATQIGQKTNGSNGGQSSSSSSSNTITAKNNGNGSSNLTVMKKLGSNPNIMLTSTNSGQKGNATNGTTGGGIIQRRRSESQAITSGPTTAAGYNSYSSDDEASISVRNVKNLPLGNLTVKPDPSDVMLHGQMDLYDYEQMQQLENSYYGTAHDLKYAKNTLLTDHGLTTGSSGIGGMAGYGSLGGGGYLTSTPLHASNSNIGLGLDYLGNLGSGHNIYDMHNQYQQQLHRLYQQQQHQQQMSAAAYPMRRYGSRAEIDILERETSSQIRNLDVSAGDLLSRTHEELVLLLIQLRRQNSNTARAIEQCCSDIHDVQNRLLSAEGLTRAESIQRLDYLKQHLLDLERQYEKSKPLVNLVDNMVKLGSLYRNDAMGRTSSTTITPRTDAVTLERLEFNQRMQEQRLLQEEQKQWDRLEPDNNELQSKVAQLCHLDQLLQEESGTLQSLQRDKEDLERALGGIKARIQDTRETPMALEAAKKQQHMLERELSRVHQLLAENSKKLEMTVAGNTRLEQELLVLRQKLTRGSQVLISDTYTNNTTAMLESELKRVQALVGDMQRQRQELSQAVKQLTENSTKLYMEIGNKEHLRNGENSSSSGSNGGSINGSGGGSIKKRTNSGCWFETDLDSMMSSNRSLTDSTMNLSTPLFVDTSGNTVANTSGNILNSSSTSSKLSDYNTGDSMLMNDSHRRTGGGSSTSYRYNDSSDNLETSGVDSDGFLESNPFANLSQQEKQEIKTVRIVKRESERRHRDRSERTGLSNSTQNLDQVMEEEHYGLMNGGGGVGTGITGGGGGNYHSDEYKTNERSKSLPRSYNEPPNKSSSRHHHRHKHNSSNNSHHNALTTSSSSNNTASSSTYNTGYKNDYFGGHGQNGQASFSSTNGGSYDKNSNYSSHRHSQNHYHHQSSSNGHNSSANTREHLNPLANAYFAKQMQQQQHHLQQPQAHNSSTSASSSSTITNHHQHSNSSHSRHSSQNALRQKTESQQSLNKSLSDLTPSFQSEAARQIINEMSAGSASEDTEKVIEKVPSQHKHRRAVPKEKRRHYTAPNNVVNVKTAENGHSENDMNKNNTNWRARDDLDMEVALRPRINAPDVVRSALRHGEKISENTIDNLLLAPNKIVIPERYIPETTPELSPEEKKRRQEKVESIKKMLSEAPISAANETAASLPPSKLNEEKKQREHLLQMNQILAQQVMQMSKIVADD
ncbi:pleckstrin homology domain-containing family A member kramer isoform X3 [Haematobia irritans]|uniref:pleckstrin homology domain-containing family A member kramer isoform X3 n=1 Tax=Haematobia irritans TaxID=7368 RepID=UPI003F4F6064